MKKACGLLLCLLLAGLCACGRAGTAEPTTKASQTEATTELTVDANSYFDMVWGWECPAGDYAAYIDDIYHTESGTAGSSGKAALKAVRLLEFSNAIPDEYREGLAPVFASMNDAQARFFAAQWIRLRALAGEALRDPGRFHESYDWAGLEDFDAALYSAERLERLDGVIASFLLRGEMQ